MNTSLTTLDMANKALGDPDAEEIAAALEQSNTLQNLDLQHNCIGEAGGSAIGTVLASNTTLTVLNLGYNFVGPEGACAIGASLRLNCTLTELNLWRNKIGETGAQAICSALEANTGLMSIILGHNELGDSGASAISSVLHWNTSLTAVDLRINNITDVGGAAIASGLKKRIRQHRYGNTRGIHLRQLSLDLAYNSISSTQLRQIQQLASAQLEPTSRSTTHAPTPDGLRAVSGHALAGHAHPPADVDKASVLRGSAARDRGSGGGAAQESSRTAAGQSLHLRCDSVHFCASVSALVNPADPTQQVVQQVAHELNSESSVGLCPVSNSLAPEHSTCQLQPQGDNMAGVAVRELLRLGESPKLDQYVAALPEYGYEYGYEKLQEESADLLNEGVLQRLGISRTHSRRLVTCLRAGGPASDVAATQPDEPAAHSEVNQTVQNNPAADLPASSGTVLEDSLDQFGDDTLVCEILADREPCEKPSTPAQLLLHQLLNVSETPLPSTSGLFMRTAATAMQPVRPAEQPGPRTAAGQSLHLRCDSVHFCAGDPAPGADPAHRADATSQPDATPQYNQHTAPSTNRESARSTDQASQTRTRSHQAPADESVDGTHSGSSCKPTSEMQPAVDGSWWAKLQEAKAKRLSSQPLNHQGRQQVIEKRYPKSDVRSKLATTVSPARRRLVGLPPSIGETRQWVPPPSRSSCTWTPTLSNRYLDLNPCSRHCNKL